MHICVANPMAPSNTNRSRSLEGTEKTLPSPLFTHSFFESMNNLQLQTPVKNDITFSPSFIHVRILDERDG